MWVEIWLCIKAKLREKNFLLNWLYIHEKKNHNVSLSMCCSLCVCLMVPTVYTLLVSTFTHCYQIELFIWLFTCLSLFSGTLCLLCTLCTDNTLSTKDNYQILHSSGPSFKGLIQPEPDLTHFPLDLSQLIPYLSASTVSVLGDKDIFSSLELLAQQWIIIWFHGKAQTVFFVFIHKVDLLFISSGANLYVTSLWESLWELVKFSDCIWFTCNTKE